MERSEIESKIHRWVVWRQARIEEAAELIKFANSEFDHYVVPLQRELRAIQPEPKAAPRRERGPVEVNTHGMSDKDAAHYRELKNKERL